MLTTTVINFGKKTMDFAEFREQVKFESIGIIESEDLRDFMKTCSDQIKEEFNRLAEIDSFKALSDINVQIVSFLRSMLKRYLDHKLKQTIL